MGESMMSGNTMYETFIGATSMVDGAAGLVPAPPINGQDYVLYGRGEWAPLPNYTSRFRNLEQNLSKIHIYKHPTHDSHPLDLYKVKIDTLGHVVKAEPVNKEDFKDAGVLTETVDSLASTNTKLPLSANQGRILEDKKMNKTGGEFTDTIVTQDVVPKDTDESDLGDYTMRYRKLYLSDGIENLTKETKVSPATGVKLSTKRRTLVMNVQHRKNMEAYRDEVVIGRFPHGSETNIANETPASYCDDIEKAALVVGNGTPKGDSDAIRVMYDGRTISESFYAANGSAYSQYLEWVDGNPDDEDRAGLFVTFVGDKIKIAKEGDYIAGIVCATPAVVSNADLYWHEQFKTDYFGRPIYEEINQVDEDDPTKMVKCLRRAVNPNFDINREYIPRSKRPEWDTVAMVGIVRVRDDGTCVVGGWCKAGENGIGTASVAVSSRSVTIPATGWMANPDGGWYMDIPVTGITEASTPIINILPTTNSEEGSASERAALGQIDKIETKDGYIRVYAFNDAPESPVTISIDDVSGSGAFVKNKTFTVPADGWMELTDGGWYLDLTVEGITESDNPTVNVVITATNAEDARKEREAYCCINQIETRNGSVRIYAFDSTPEIPVTISLVSVSQEFAKDNPDSSLSKNFIATLPTTGWSQQSDKEEWSMDIPVTGITEDDNPTVNIVLSAGSAEQAQLEREAYACITQIETHNGFIRPYVCQIPTVPVTIGLSCTSNEMSNSNVQPDASYKVVKRITNRIIEIQLK